MSVVVIGSGGMLGSALLKEFAGEVVHGLDHKAIDITDPVNMEKVLRELKATAVINAVAFNSVDEAEKNDETFALAKKINGAAVGDLAAITKRLDIPLVHFSTEYVFAGTEKNGYDEGASPSPINRYGETKFLGEKLLQENTDQFYLVRLSRMFGAPGTSTAAKKSFVDIMLDLVLKQGKTELKIVDEEISCPTYSVDLARVVHGLLKEQKPFGIYHAANVGACSWFALANEVFRLKNITVKTVPVSGSEFPRPAKRPQFSMLINTKLPPQKPWQEALAEYLKD